MPDSTAPPLLPDDALPSFERPPVVETVLGVQFKRLPGFRNAHLGAFWKYLEGDWCKLLRGTWSLLIDAPTLDPAFERFGESGSWAPLGAGLKLTGDPSARLQIRNEAGDAMIQIQNGRLHYNWLGSGEGEYVRYRKVRPRFDELLGGFNRFLDRESLGEFQPDQWEITYVNHIPKGTIWNTPEDWPEVLVGLGVLPVQRSVVRLETFAGAWHFEIESQRGRLHVEARHARQDGPRGQEVLHLTLTARGPASDQKSMSEGLDLGRQSIVTTFKEMTSAKAHQYWGLRS